MSVHAADLAYGWDDLHQALEEDRWDLVVSLAIVVAARARDIAAAVSSAQASGGPLHSPERAPAFSEGNCVGGAPASTPSELLLASARAPERALASDGPTPARASAGG